jgi:putative hydrolase of the HAD superfamily
MAIKTCFFDMGNVLVFFSHERMCQNIAELCGWSLPQTKTFLLEEGRQWKLERGDISEEEFHAEFCEATGRKLDIDKLRHAAADIFWLNDSILPVLHQLKTAGKKLVLLSNTSITHLRFIEQRFSVLNLMDERVTSFEVGAMKPDPRIFHAALARAAGPPQSCFYTDDIEAYINQAQSMGIHSHLYRTTEQLTAALQQTGAL